jgi:phosphoribosylanthranilate isomerase
MATTKIKICGITSADDALACLKAGADFLGFNFYPKSPRYLKPEQAKGVLDDLRMQGFGNAMAVGLFVNAPVEEIRRAMALCGMRIVQLHGSETRETIEQLKGFLRIKAVKMADASSAEAMESLGADAYLAEAPHPTLEGGTGMSYDYAVAAEPARKHKLFLAGGLDAENVAEAIRRVQPFAVDVASGVERGPGKKDNRKVEAFCRAVRGA